MSAVDPRWAVPVEYEYVNLDPSRPLIETGRMKDWPETGLLGFRRLELHLAGQGTSPLDLAAWQLASASGSRAIRTVAMFQASTPAASADDRLTCGHVLAIANDEEATMRSADLYTALWKGDELPLSHPRRFELGVSLAADVLPYSSKKASSVLEGVRPLLEQATRSEQAMFELVFAMSNLKTDPDASGAAIERAHELFIGQVDPIGMAQCALAEYQRERASSNRAEAMLEYLSYAVHQYEVGCRYAWAAATLWSAMVPLLADRMGAAPAALARVFGRAAGYADRGRSHGAWESVRRFAARFGLCPREVDGAWVFEAFTSK